MAQQPTFLPLLVPHLFPNQSPMSGSSSSSSWYKVGAVHSGPSPTQASTYPPTIASAPSGSPVVSESRGHTMSNIKAEVDVLTLKVDVMAFKLDPLQVQVDGLQVQVTELGQKLDGLSQKLDWFMMVFQEQQK